MYWKTILTMNNHTKIDEPTPKQMSFQYWFDYYCNLATWFNDNFETLTDHEVTKFRHELLTIANRLIHHISENQIFDNSDDSVVRNRKILMIDVEQMISFS